ncbi:MAG: hypothetical protein HC813_00785 [Planctomycetes bacterium]|nr:hypothetical protein [Planctomycetota bacterium]
MSSFASFLLVGRHAFEQTLRGKRLLLLLVLAAAPVLLALLISGARSVEGLLDYQTWSLVILHRGLVPLAALYLGVAVLGDEIDGRTITFLFTRPLPRPLLLLARYLGISLAFLLVLTLSVGLSGALFARRIPVDLRGTGATLAIAAGGFLAYGALFATLRLFLQRALLVGFLIAFIVEGALRALPPGGFGVISIGHHLSVMQSTSTRGCCSRGRNWWRASASRRGSGGASADSAGSRGSAS